MSDSLDPAVFDSLGFDRNELKGRFKERARELGFVGCGVASAAPSQSSDRLEAWLKSGMHAQMNWMARPDAVEKRADIRAWWPDAQSVICVALPYRVENDGDWNDDQMGKIARYARGDDYHDFLKQKLRDLFAWLQLELKTHDLAIEGKIAVDTSPILEREWAVRAGLGWIGKNSLLMGREFGSYVLLGELVVDFELPSDEPHVAQFCGSCTRCMDACPTDALVAPGVLDANRCISYHTIESRKLAPIELREKFEDWIFGCDICQEVCPWNEKAARNEVWSGEPQLWQRAEMPSLSEWNDLPPEEFSRRLKNSPIKRTKKRGMKRNATRALKNRRTQ